MTGISLAVGFEVLTGVMETNEELQDEDHFAPWKLIS